MKRRKLYKFLLVFMIVVSFFLLIPETLWSESSLRKEEKDQIACIAKGIFFEAGNQSELGKIAVGHVILSRMRIKHMTACEVIYEKDSKGRKQFLWDHAAIVTIRDERYVKSLEVAKNLKKTEDPTNGALYFHNIHVKPHWKNLQKTVQIEGHVFYK